MRFMNIRCQDCEQLFSVRRPKNPNLVAPILARIRCPACFPNSLEDVCVSCRLPYEIVGNHANGMCGACVRRLHYWSLTESQRGEIRVRELQRWHDARVTKRSATVE